MKLFREFALRQMKVLEHNTDRELALLEERAERALQFNPQDNSKELFGLVSYWAMKLQEQETIKTAIQKLGGTIEPSRSYHD